MGRRKLLVANRSEIACRVFQTCREMGISTVGVYTAADRQARHVTFADEVVEIKSYLDGAEIITLAKQLGVGLIHPGYGFLSEQSGFAREVEKAGMIFVGPRAETMDLMGEKIQAKTFAEKSGVPTLPWIRVEKGMNLQEAVKEIRFPLLVKAALGGGGKGMRKVTRKEDLEDAVARAYSEAQSSFGEGDVFIEKCVEKPRHIEIQIFGDGNGDGVHLFERECSLQRRHQKIWEEAPATLISKSVREKLHDSALKLLKSTKYRNAGTIEFLVDSSGEFYFLEMNTRLQVEHPVTESVTGVDLVRAQIQQALEPKKSFLHEVPSPRGHAIEVRLYAEDPAQGFLPSPGKIQRLKWPSGLGIRVDSGIEEGQVITPDFDPMLAKLIVFAEDRERCISRLQYALEETVLLGVKGNQLFLQELCKNSKVKSGDFYTQFIENELMPFEVSYSEEMMNLVSSFGGQIRRSSSPIKSLSSVPSPWETFA